MNVESGFELQDLLRMLKRRAGLIAGVAGVTFLAAYWVAMALPNEYESYATLLVEPQAVNQNLVEPGAEGADLNARLHLMTAEILSRPRLSRLIDELELYEDESTEMLREEIIDLMREHVRVEPVLPELQTGDARQAFEINTFRIFFRSDSARTAAAVAQRLANDFIEQHIDARVQVTQKSLEFIESEQLRLSNRIEQVEGQLAELKTANPGRLPEDLDSNQRLYERTLSELRDAQRVLDAAKGDEAFYRNQAVAARSSGTGGSDANPVKRLEQLELLQAEYKAKGFTEKHPDVLKTQDEIEGVKLIIAELEKDVEAGGSLSPAQQSADAERQRATQKVQAAQQEIDRLREQIHAIEERLAQTPGVADRIDTFLREYEALRGSLADFAERQLEATVQASLERRQLGEQFRVLESAFPAPEPSSPNRPLILVMGLLLGVALGGGVALLAESAGSSVYGARELQTALSLPVLAAIPEILLESDRSARRRRRLRLALVATVLTLFCLAGGAVTYMWVNGAPGWLRAGDQQEQVGSIFELEERV